MDLSGLEGPDGGVAFKKALVNSTWFGSIDSSVRNIPHTFKDLGERTLQLALR